MALWGLNPKPPATEVRTDNSLFKTKAYLMSTVKKYFLMRIIEVCKTVYTPINLAHRDALSCT